MNKETPPTFYQPPTDARLLVHQAMLMGQHQHLLFTQHVSDRLCQTSGRHFEYLNTEGYTTDQGDGVTILFFDAVHFRSYTLEIDPTDTVVDIDEWLNAYQNRSLAQLLKVNFMREQLDREGQEYYLRYEAIPWVEDTTYGEHVDQHQSHRFIFPDGSFLQVLAIAYPGDEQFVAGMVD